MSSANKFGIRNFRSRLPFWLEVITLLFIVIPIGLVAQDIPSLSSEVDSVQICQYYEGYGWNSPIVIPSADLAEFKVILSKSVIKRRMSKKKAVGEIVIFSANLEPLTFHWRKGEIWNSQTCLIIADGQYLSELWMKLTE